jgi:YD repeat-containing protein
MKTSSNKAYVQRRQRIAQALATIYILASQTPLMIGLAAPQVYFRPAGGVSRLPLQVGAFNPPGFGEVEDAINLATGNVYVAMDGASRNNNLEATTTPGGPKKDETTSSMQSNWSLNARLRLNGFNRNWNATTLPVPAGNMFIGSGDFQPVTMDATAFALAPSWIQRYQTMTVADLAATKFYALSKKPGEQYSSEWLVVRLRTTGGAIAHYYQHDGTRNSFFNDGEFVDYTQNLFEQYRGARYNADPEGDKVVSGSRTTCLPDVAITAACTPRTEFSYDTAIDTSTGRITKIKDAWGRVTTYDWAVGGALDGTLTNINYLLRTESDSSTYARQATFVYTGASGTTCKSATMLTATVVCSVKYTAYSGKKDGGSTAQPSAKVFREFRFEYTKLNNGAIVVSKIQRPVGAGTGFADTTYEYYDSTTLTDVKNGKLKAVTEPGMAKTTYDYSPGLTNIYDGQTYTVSQGDLVTGKQTKYLFDKFGQLIKREVRDYNPIGHSDIANDNTRTLTSNYSYFTNGSLLQVAPVLSADNLKNWQGAASVSLTGTPITDLTNTDSDGMLDKIFNSTNTTMKTTVTIPAGGSISPSMVLATDRAAGANISLGLQNSAGVRLIPDTLCALTTTPTTCQPTGRYTNSSSSDLTAYVVLSGFWTSVSTYAGGTRSNVLVSVTSKNYLTPIIPVTSADTVSGWPVQSSVSVGSFANVTDTTGTDANGLESVYTTTNPNRISTTLTVPAGVTVQPSVVLANQAATPAGNVSLGLESTTGSKLIPDMLCPITAVATTCTANGAYTNSTASAVTVNLVLSGFWTSKATFVGGARANAYTTSTTITQPVLSAFGSTQSVTDSAGKRTEFMYDQYGNVNDVKVFPLGPTPLEREEQWTYDSDNQLLNHTRNAQSGTRNGVTYSYGNVVDTAGYTYNSFTSNQQVFRVPSAISMDVSPVGKAGSKVFFDEAGRVTSRQVQRDGTVRRTTTITYKGGEAYSPFLAVTNNDTPASTDIALPVKQYGDLPATIDRGFASESRTFFYDAFGNRVEEKATGALTTADAAGNIIAADHKVIRSFNGFGQQVFNKVFSNQSIGQVDFTNYAPSGAATDSWEGNPNNVTQYSYDSSGRVSTVVHGVGTNGSVSSSSSHNKVAITYDPIFGRVATQVTDGVLTKNFSYDTLDRLVRATHLQSADSGEGLVYEDSRYSVGGIKSYACQYGGRADLNPSSTDNQKRCMINTVDSLGRITNTKDWTATPGAPFDVSFTYDNFDHVIVKQNYALIESTNTTDGITTYFGYDDHGHLIKQLDPIMRGIPYAAVGLGGTTYISDSRRPFTQYVYTTFGLMYAKAVLTKGTVDPSQLAQYSILGSGICPKPTDIYVDLSVAITCTNYDTQDRVSSTYDADGYQTVFGYDALSNRISETRMVWKSTTEYGRSPDTDAGFDTVTTKYASDAVGRKVLTIDARGTNTGVKYDTLGNPLAEMTDTKRRSNLVDYIDTKITTKAYQYTSDGLLERVAEPLLSDTTNVSGWGLTFNGVTPPIGYGVTKLLEYGLTDRAVATKKCDAFKNVAPTLAGEKCATYTYDALNRVRSTKLTQPTGSTITQTYDIRNNVVSLTDADGFTTNYKYDARGQMLQQTNLRRAGSIDMTALPNDLTNFYSYDNAGNLKNKIERGLTTKYVYNTIGKVIAESRPSTGASIDKLYAYRLDGGLVATTVYGTVASAAFANPDNFGGTVRQLPESGTNGSGAILGYQLSPAGLRIAEYHTVPNLAANYVAYISRYRINGLGQWFLRDFIGGTNTYEIAYASGSVNGANAASRSLGVNYKTYRKFNQNGQLIASVDEYPANPPSIPAAVRRNAFAYDYSPTGKQLNEKRDVQVVAGKAANWSNVPTNYKDQSYDLASSQNGAGLNYSNAWYNERDQLEKASIYDTNSNGAAAVQRDTLYKYFDDGSEASVQIGGLAAQTKEFDYDARGRQIQVKDVNGQGNGTTSYETTTYSGTGINTSALTTGAAAPGGTQIYRSSSTQTIAGLQAASSTNNSANVGGCPELVTSCTNSSTIVYDSNGYVKTNSVTAGETNKTALTETATYTTDQYGQNTTYATGIITKNIIYNDIGAITEENATSTSNLQTLADISQRPLTISGASAFPKMLSSGQLTGASYYKLDSRGMRLAHSGNSGSSLSGRSKRYNAEMKVSWFSLSSESNANDGQTISGYQTGVGNNIFPPGFKTVDVFEIDRLYFRYDPFGNQVFSVKANILEHGGYQPPIIGNGAQTAAQIKLQTYSVATVDGSTQALILRSGNAGSHLNRFIGFAGSDWGYLEYGGFTSNNSTKENAVQDETFGLYEGVVNNAPSFDVAKPFSVITPPSGPGNAALEAPTTALSTSTKVDPTAIEAPGSSTPASPSSTDITAPGKDQPAKDQPTSSAPAFSSGANLNANTFSPTVSTPAFGVTSFTINTNVIPSSTSSPASTKAESIPAFTSQFSLEAPVSVLPPAISSFSVTSIVNPLEDLSAIPNLGSVSDIAAPGIAAPGTVSTPSSGAGGITAPSDSSAGIPELPRIESPNGNVSSVVKPVLSGDSLSVTPLDLDPDFARFIAELLKLVATLDDAQTRQEMKKAYETGDPNLMASAGLGALIRADILFDSGMNNTDRKNLAAIDEKTGKADPVQQVEFRTQLLFELYKCGDNDQCKKELLQNLAGPSSGSGKSEDTPSTAAGLWGNTPKHAMSPSEKFTGIAGGFMGWNSWNEKHFKNQRPIFRVYGFQFRCGRKANEIGPRVLANIPHFYGVNTFTSMTISPLRGGPDFVRSIPPNSLNSQSLPAPINIIFTPKDKKPKVGTFVDIDAWVGVVVKREGDVKISFIASNAWTFRTESNHVIYDNSPGAFPGQISFALYDLGQNQTGAFVVAQGNFANNNTQNEFNVLGASSVEDAIWTNWAKDIQEDCGKK